MKEITVVTSEVVLSEMHFVYKVKVDEKEFENVLAEFHSLSNDHNEIYESLDKYQFEQVDNYIKSYLDYEPDTEIYNVEAN
ncbi:hypothetical protein [Sulfurimonas xiamenensis]|uniref:Uncharacterized protein n=1 Tax=Sulfurimonas xiamenensis TaxID=2590021 RepID=A0AAJ4A2T8_9BACT|nr:hypothetical protein [Sulfurimonas xiamenensis]QFR42882.1 hypothetical protein FJR47_02735 [Sulfurimonas xiamenensis]